MNEFVGKETKYLLARIHEDSKREEVANYNDYSGTFTFMTDLSRATHFEELEKVERLRDLQALTAELMGSGYVFKVIQQEITRTLVEETK